MKSTTDQFFVIRSTNPTTMRVVVEKARFTLEDAIAIAKTANDTEDAWFYEVVICSGASQFCKCHSVRASVSARAT